VLLRGVQALEGEVDPGIVVRPTTRDTATPAKPFAIVNAGPREYYTLLSACKAHPSNSLTMTREGV
jgi:hypothetical protein